jgi:hypothetical protein
VTAVVIDLAQRRAARRPEDEDAPLNRCDQPAIIAACVSLTVRGHAEEPCGGLLAYQDGRWWHVNTGPDFRCCPEAQAATCQHPACTQTAGFDQVCAAGGEHCCGCCWAYTDDLEGRQLWPTN